MYKTCLFCYSDLGVNEVVEHFPVGRRLAFDAAKGRLWVVCRRCERWNLTPIEERWEAIEACERTFAATKLRVSTDNVGFARLREGLELVRIGKPQLPEMAAWRYGDQFGRRRRRYIMFVAAPSVVVPVVMLGGQILGVFAVGTYGLYQALEFGVNVVRRKRSTIRVHAGDQVVKIDGKDLRELRIVRTQEPHAWSLLAPSAKVFLPGSPPPLRSVHSGPADRLARLTGWSDRAVEFRGDDAVGVLRKALPFLNAEGGSRQLVQKAVSELEEAPAVERYVATAAWKLPPRSISTSLLSLPRHVLLALEMAVHEQTERYAMEVELAKLEDEWRYAEEIAAIADDMFVPQTILDWIERHRPARVRAATSDSVNASR